MGARLYDTHKIVERLLNDYPDTRNSDDLLYLIACKDICPSMANMPFENVILNINKLGLPKYKSVERTRRKIQAEKPELRATKEVEDKKYENWKEYREYALT